MTKRIVLAVLAIAMAVLAVQPALAQFDRAVEVKKHLEREDYNVSMDSERLTAQHSKWLNLTIRSYKNGLLLRAWLETTEYRTDDLETLANELNYKATATRIYIDNENDLIYECWFPGRYDRDRFATMLDAWHEDTIGQSEIVRNHLGL